MKPLTPEEQKHLNQDIAKVLKFIQQRVGNKTLDEVVGDIVDAAKDLDGDTEPITPLQLCETILDIATVITENTDTQVDDQIVTVLKDGLAVAEGNISGIGGGFKALVALIHLRKTAKAEAKAAAETTTPTDGAKSE